MKIPEIVAAMEHLDDGLVSAAVSYQRPKEKRPWVAWAAIAACLCLLLAVPAWAAAGSGYAYEALYSLAPSIAQRLKPVRLTCEANGIEMEVIAAEIEGEKATILVAMTDKTGTRLDETTDLFDSYSIHTPYDQIGGCTFVEYRPETRTAVFLLRIEQMDHALIPGDKITFSICKLLAGKAHSDMQLQALSDVPEVTQWVEQPNLRGGSFVDDERFVVDGRVMAPQTATSLAPGVTLTGCGIVGNELHVQMHYDDILNTDNHGYAYLKAHDGRRIIAAESIAFWDDSGMGSYEEYVFPDVADDLSEYALWGELWTCPQGAIEGDWQLTFPLTEGSAN